MKNSVNLARSTLGLAAFSLILASCKPVADGGSEVSSVTSTTPVIRGDKEQFNLAEYIAKNKIGGAAFKTNIKAGNTFIFFNSNKEEHPDANNKAELAKSPNRAKLSKPEFELKTNLTLTSNAKSNELKTLFWIDALLNDVKLPVSGHTVQVDVVGSVKSAITVKADVQAFGKNLISKSLTKASPLNFKKSIDLELKPTLLGIPKIAGISAGVTFVAAATVTSEIDNINTSSVTVSMVPDVKVTAGIEGTVKALLFAQASASGNVTVLDASFPSSATLGGRAKSGADYLYGNVTFDPGTFTALKGQIVISAKASLATALPKGVDASIWAEAAGIKSSELTKMIKKGYQWAYVVWDSPPLINVKFPTFASESFLVSDAKKAKCAGPILTTDLKALKTDVAGDKGELKTVGTSAEAGLKAILAQANKTAGSCSLK